MRHLLIVALVAFASIVAMGCGEDSPSTRTPGTPDASATAIAAPNEAELPLRPDRRVLYAATIDGSGVRKLFDDARFEHVATAVGEDERRVALAAWSPGGAGGLFIVDLASGDVTELLSHPDTLLVGPKAWSPDGRFITFRREVDTVAEPPSPPSASFEWQLAVYDVDSRTATTLDTGVLALGWSRDSSAIYTMSDNINAGVSIFRTEIESGTTSEIVYQDGLHEATLSPDGTRLAYVWGDASTGDQTISIVNSDGGGTPVDLVTVQENDASVLNLNALEWSPSGDRIAYAVINYEGREADGVYAVDVRSGETTRLTESGEYFDYGGSWSPDGSHLLVTRGTCYACDGGGPITTLLVTAAGETLDTIENTPSVAWSPGGGGFAYGSDALYVRDAGGTARAIAEMGNVLYANLRWAGDELLMTPVDLDWTRIYAMDPNAATVEMLASSSRDMTLSPDGRYVAEFSEPKGVTIIEEGETVARFDNLIGGGESYEIYQSTIVWSPASDAVAVSLGYDGAYGLVVLSASGERTLLHDGPVDSLRWSPDGERIAFVSDGEVMVVKADGSATASTIAVIPGAPSYDSPIDWSPGGDEVAFVEGGMVRAARADGSGQVRDLFGIASEALSPSALRWSPEGARVAVGTSRLVVGEVDSGRTRRFEKSAVRSLAWSPDGSRLAFAGSASGDDHGTFVLDVATNAIVHVATSSGRWEDVLSWNERERLIIAITRQL